MKGIPYEAILALTEDEIAETFPFGIVAEATDRWRPAKEGEEAHKELGELVQAKHDRQDRVRLMARRSEMGYTDFPGRAMAHEPEAVDEETQRRFSKDAQTNFAVTHAEDQRRAEIRSYVSQLRQLAIAQAKAGVDPIPALAKAKAQLEGERRKEAA